MSLRTSLRNSHSITPNARLSRHHEHLTCPAAANPAARAEKRRTLSSTVRASAAVRGSAQIMARGRSGNFRAALAVFDAMPRRDVISWTALLSAYADKGDILHARRVFDEMPNRNVSSWNAMISAYARERKVYDALELFERMPERNGVSYAAMVSCFARAGMMWEAEEIYAYTPVEYKDPVASNSLLSGYLRKGDLQEAIRVFEGMTARDIISWSSILGGYCKKGMIKEARKMFEEMPDRNVVSWTAMIHGYLKAGLWEDGLQTFELMRKEGVSVNTFTLSCILDACSDLGKITEGAQIQGIIRKMGFSRDCFLGNTLITMYSSSADHVDNARIAFEEMEKKDLVSWNSIISGYVHSNRTESAYELFQQMPVRDVISWTSMMVGFCNSGLLEEAVLLFHEMPKKDDVAWTAMISGFVANEEHELAFNWFNRMLHEGISPNHLSLSSMLSASSGLSVLSQGTQVHAFSVKMSMEVELSVQNALVSMYSKCGSFPDARQIFSDIQNPNTVSMNAMITAFAQHGLAREALDLRKEMERKGCEPNEVTFLALLSACSHAGLVNEGLELFFRMGNYYSIKPGRDHYTCMVDLLGRAGMLEEAVDLIRSMPVEPHAAVWGALLGASRERRHLPLAECSARRIIELEPENAAAYAVLSEMYAVAGLKKNEEDLRTAKRSRGVQKSPGCSWISLDKKVTVFLAGQKAHPGWEIILETLALHLESQ